MKPKTSQGDTKPTKNLPTNFIKRLFFAVKIEGESLWPELIPGKSYLATSMLKPKTGDYIVFRNPKNPGEIFAKKVKKIVDGSYEVTGTIPRSSSSTGFGLVPDKLVLGKIIMSSFIYL